MTSEREDPYDVAAKEILKDHPDGVCTTDEMGVALRSVALASIPRHWDKLELHIEKLLRGKVLQSQS